MYKGFFVFKGESDFSRNARNEELPEITTALAELQNTILQNIQYSFYYIDQNLGIYVKS